VGNALSTSRSFIMVVLSETKCRREEKRKEEDERKKENLLLFLITSSNFKD